MTCIPDASVLKALLGACRIHGDLVMGEHVANQVLEVDSRNLAGYALLSNTYCAAGKWDLTSNVQQQRLERGVKN
jgi:hypothetical protein